MTAKNIECLSKKSFQLAHVVAMLMQMWNCFSLMQEATQAENALIMENGTHAEEANADDLTVMLLLSSPSCFLFSLKNF